MPDSTLRDLLIRTDSIASLVGHRFATSVPFDVAEELRSVSTDARKLSDDLAPDLDALAVQVAEARWSGRYIGDLTSGQWDEVYDFLGRSKPDGSDSTCHGSDE